MANLYDKASLVMIPSQYKDGNLYNIKPLKSSFEFERGSISTRINKNGLIENVSNDTPRLDYSGSEPSLLLEPQRTNLFTDSEGFNGMSYLGTSHEFVSITSPDGTTNGVKRVTATTTNQARIEEQLFPSTLNENYTWSIFVKKDTARYVGLSHFSESINRVIFDLDDGVIVSDNGSFPAKIESFTNGWYRISKGVYLPSGITSSAFKFHLATQNSLITIVIGESAYV